MFSRKASEIRVAARYALMKNAGPLTNVAKLRYQAVFMMGAGGSGKGHVSKTWMKYAPKSKGEAGSVGEDRKLTDLKFEKAVERLERQGIRVQITDTGNLKIPFRLTTEDHEGRERVLDPADWDTELPPNIYKDVKGMTELIFKSPKSEFPSYWRQINPDLYKEEIPGYQQKEPGYVHEMSSDMSKAYFEAAIETGDPLFVDGTGAKFGKMSTQMQLARSYGYGISLVLVSVPLTVNQIRNATRERKVNPFEIMRQWNLIQKNYVELRPLADVAKVIPNRNDAFDIAAFRENQDEINDFFFRKSGGKYPTLYSFIEAKAPRDLDYWGPILEGGESLERVVQKQEEDKRKEELMLKGLPKRREEMNRIKEEQKARLRPRR